MKKALHAFDIKLHGKKFHVRPIIAEDQPLIEKGFAQLSENSRYLRFFAVQPKLTDYQLKYFAEADGVDHVAWGILDITKSDPIAVGVGRFIRLIEDPETAEIALTIIDAYQRQGLGRVLFAVLNIAAARQGIKKFRYYVLESNRFVLDMLSHMDILNKSFEEGVIVIDISVHADHYTLSAIPELRNLKAMMKKIEALLK